MQSFSPEHHESTAGGTTAAPHSPGLRLPRAIAAGLLGAALVVGLVARFGGLDRGPLSVDEYYFARAVNHVVHHGVPLFPSGGLYIRGLVPQYVAAISVRLLGETELALRLPGVLWSLLGVFLAYLYCRRFTDRFSATAVAVSLLLSSWHIEFALFVRMYGALQCVTLLFLLALDDVCFRGRWDRRYLPHLLLIGGTLTHFLAILFAPLLFLPLADRRTESRFPTRAQRLRFVGVGIVVTLACLVIVDDEFRDLGVRDKRPADYISPPRADRSDYWVPQFVLWRATGDRGTDLALLVVLLAGTGLGLEWLRRRTGRITRAENLAVLLLLATAGHMFLLSAVFLLALLLRYGIPRRGDPHGRRVLGLIAASAAVGTAWLVHALTFMASLDPQARGAIGAVKLVRKVFFDWPQFYRAVYEPWAQNLPLIGLALFVALGHQLLSKRRLALPALLGQPAFIVIYVAVCLSVLRPTYIEIRYAFFIYPLILCTIAQSLAELARHRVRDPLRATLVAGALYLALFGLSSDFNPRHLADTSAPGVVFRQGEFERYQGIWYSREDVETPADFVNRAAANESDQVVVINQPPVSYYLQRDHAVYYDRRSRRFSNVSRAQGTIDLWSDHPLLSTRRDLEWFTRDASVVWLVRGNASDPREFDCATIWGLRYLGASRAFLSRDGRIEVLRVALRSPDAQQSPEPARASLSSSSATQR